MISLNIRRKQLPKRSVNLFQMLIVKSLKTSLPKAPRRKLKKKAISPN